MLERLRDGLPALVSPPLDRADATADGGVPDIAFALDLPFGVVLFDAEDRLVWHNPAMTAIEPSFARVFRIGATFATLVTEAVAAGAWPRAIEDQASWIERTLRRRKRPESSIRVQTAENRWVLATHRRLASGMMLETRSDVTAWCEREAELLGAREKAIAADVAKSDFLATMSHEIRTPLNGLLGMARILRDSGLSDKQRGYADVIVQSGRSLLTIINDILDFSKLNAGHLVLRSEAFDLVEIVERVRSTLAVAAADKGLALTTTVAPDLPVRFVGDADRIQQMLLNLVGNAVKFTESGGVDVRVACSAHGDHSAITIAVADTGIGIPPDHLDAVFERFSQVDNSRSRKHEGTGLGLTITRTLAELMGGTVSLASELGRGSTFTLSLHLPVADATPEAAPRAANELADRSEGPAARDADLLPSMPAARSPATAGETLYRGRRILLVGASAALASLATALRDGGAEIVAEETTRSALPAFQVARSDGRPFDLVVLDGAVPDYGAAAIALAALGRLGRPGVPVLHCADRASRVPTAAIRQAGTALADNLAAIHDSLGLQPAAATSPDAGSEAAPIMSPVASPAATMPAAPATLKPAQAPPTIARARGGRGSIPPFADAPGARAPAGPVEATIAEPPPAPPAPAASILPARRAGETAVGAAASAVPPPVSADRGARRFGQRPADPAVETARRVDILVAEDHEVNQKLMESVLDALGYSMVLAVNGAKAVQYYQKYQPSLILMDVSMPEMNGFEATAAIRWHEMNLPRRTPIIGVTAHAMSGDRKACIEAGMDDYVPKPVDIDELAAKIKHWLAQGSAEIAA